MKINKNLIISVLLVLVMFCVISTASAEDRLNENLTISNTNELAVDEDSFQNALEVSDREDKLSEGNTLNVGEGETYTTISAAVSAANSGDTIFIKNGEYSESARLSLNKSLSFVGESQDGVIITSSASNQGIFQMMESDVVLSFNQLTFSNVNAGTGSNLPIKIGGNSNVDIINCSFIGCSSKFGAIQLYTTGTATVSDCTIKDFKSTASGGTGGIYLSGQGTYNIVNTEIVNSQFTGSSGYMYGIIYISGNTSVSILDNISISDCKGAASSVIYAKAKTIVKNSKILNNTVEKSASGYQGESIFYTNYNTKNNPNAELIIEQSIIAGNSGPNNFIYANANAKTTLNYCNVQNNSFGTTFNTTNGNFNFEYNYWGSNDLPVNLTVTRYAVIDSEGNFLDDQGNALAKEIPQIISDDEPQPTVLDIIYISDSDGSNENDGSMSSPVKTIEKAIEITQNGKIVILTGNYTLTETLSIDKDLDIEGRGNVFIKSSSQIISTSKSLNLTKIAFDSSANIVGAVISTTNDLKIDSCVFYTNSETASAINVDGGKVNIANSVLLNPLSFALTATDSSTVTAINNWWGNNTGANSNVSISSWIVMNATIDLERINPNDEVTITVSFNQTNDGNDYTGNLPEFNVTVTASNLNQNITVKNNKASVKYSVETDDEVNITSGSESIKLPLKLYIAPDIIYVNTTGADNNDGDEQHPVKSIAQAITLAQKGKIIILEGNYTLDNTLNISKDLDITGVGKVIVNASEKRFLSNNANLNISNIEFMNGKDNGGALLNNANLTLTNVSIYSCVNSVGSGASVIRNNKKLTIINSKFYDNEALRGNIHNEKGELTIVNSEFYNNKFTQNENAATGYGIYNYQGNVTIENSIFRQNDGASPFIYSYGDPNRLTVVNCTFEDNNMSRFGVVVAQNTIAQIINSTFKNNHADKTSTNNGEGGAVYISNGNVSVENSQFINNKADSGKDIYVYSGELNISQSILINENGYSIEKGASAIVTANDNWWGANTPNTQINVDRWIIMSVTCNDSDIRAGDKINISVSFDKTNSSEGIADYTGNLGDLNVTLLPSTTKTTSNKVAEFTYTVGEDDKNITITSSNASQVLKVRKVLDIIYVSGDGDDNNDGDWSTPVNSLSKAIELAEKGQIIIQQGTYKTGDLGIISNDLNITGNGSVIIDASNNNRIFYIHNTSNVVLKNIVMINGYTSASNDESGAVLGNSGNLTLINCTLANSKSEKNAGAIYNAGNLVVINSTFENNTADKCGGAIFTQNAGIGITPSLSVENSIFKNNTAGGNSNFAGGAIFVQQASNVSIVDSLFEINKANQYGGGAIEIVNTEIATVDKSTFINNTANGEDYDQKSDYGGGAISFIGSYGDLKEELNVLNSLFIDNSISHMGGGAIYTRYAKVNVSNSVLINNNDVNNVSIYRRSTDVNTAKITANDNWWGSNDNPKANINAGTLSSWIILSVLNESEIKEGSTVNITVTLNTVTDGNENSSLTSPLTVKRPVTVNTNLGNIEGTLVNGEFKTEYAVPDGLKYISASVDGQEAILYVVTSETKLEIENITALMGNRIAYTVNVTSDENVNKGNVEVYFNDTLIKSIPVINGKAADTIIINKKTGIYDITVKYVDSTKEFGNQTANAILNVTGIDNIVNSTNFNNFFDNNVLMSDIPFDEIFFEGLFENMGVLTINKTISITGINALLNDTIFKIIADNVSINNFTLTLNKNYADSDNACIYVGGNNAVISNNNITYLALDNQESYVISVDVASNVSIINNDIKYSAKSEGDVKTIAVNVVKANNFKFENNLLNANIPSVNIGYTSYPYTYFSQAIHIENTNIVSIKNNTVNTSYSNVQGAYDTIYAIHVTSSNNTSILDNKINLDGYNNAYAVVSDGKNIIISNNEINVTSADYYACAVNINSDSTGVINGNNITSTSRQVVYPIYIDDWYSSNPSEVNVTGNKIYGNSTNVYSIYIQANKSMIADNNIVAKGNFTMGITSYDTDIIVTNNNITSNGTNEGIPLSPQGSVPNETTGICAAKGSVSIYDNNIISTGANAIDAIESEGVIKNNNLTAKDVKGDSAINNNASSLEIDNNASSGIENKSSQDTENETPTQIVYKLTADNLKMYYCDGSLFKARITADGKALSQATVKVIIAGKTHTLKSDKNGYVSVKVTNLPGKYTATLQYSNLKLQKTITVLQSLTSKNVNVKKSAKKLVLKATLKNGKKVAKGKRITFKFNGKTYKANTNSKGIAQITIKKNVIKKLKAGKKYTVKITYLKDTIRKTVKVKK